MNNTKAEVFDTSMTKVLRKDLGAFYTPIPYCEKAAELVRDAIKRVPAGNDYVIIDRCAGTGNLESVLSDEELGHCILSTYEYYEWLVLKERLEDKVLKVLPEGKPTINDGLIVENNALSEDYLNNAFIKSYIDNPKCTIIMLENPPYAETMSMTAHMNKDKYKQTADWKKNIVTEEFKKEIKGVASNEMANSFIWSAFKYYLRQPTDSLIVFGPAKYIKTQKIINKEYVKGFIFNRKHFHATASAITCIEWKNEGTFKPGVLSIYDIEKNDKGKECAKFIHDIKFDQVNTIMSSLYDKRKFDDDTKDGVLCDKCGYETTKPKSSTRIDPIFNKNIIGYLEADSSTIDPKTLELLCSGVYDGNGFFLRSDNYLKKLPLFAAKSYYQFNQWYERDYVMNTADSGTAFETDNDFLKSCLIFTCLSQYNKCFNLHGSDGRDYFNELSFDSLSTHKPLALTDLATFTLTDEEKELITLWNKVMQEAANTKNYNKNYSYGLYQIINDLDTYKPKKLKASIVYDYPILHSYIIELKNKNKAYYLNNIKEKLFKYELLK